MKWPFARHAHSAPPSGGDAGDTTTVEPARAAAMLAPARRDWATMPPLQVAGGRPINLTASTRTFTEGLASRQVLVRATRLEMVRRIDAPSGSLRGILSPSVGDHEGPPMPDVQDASPLPSVEHRHVAAASGEPTNTHGLSPIEQLLAIGEPVSHETPPLPPAVTPPPSDLFDSPGDGGLPATGRRAGLADSRRRGLGPAYHGPLPEAMRAERQRIDDGPDDGSGVYGEAVPDSVRASMRDVLGVDVGDRLVHRGPAVSAEASAMGAQAFSRDGELFIADEVGPLDEARGRATLAHEMTHAAQQIVHGVLHDEASPAGRAMEAHAQQVEQFVRGDGGAIKPTPDMLHAKPPTAPSGDGEDAALVASTHRMMKDLVDSGLARHDGSGGIIFTMPPSSMTAATGTQRLTTGAPTAHAGTPAAQPGAAAQQSNWSGAGVFANNLAQGLGNDLLGVAGSLFGFSDEFMGEQRHELQNANREFQREQTKQAYTELRMEHLRTTELERRNAEEARFDLERTQSLDDTTVQNIQTQVNAEVEHRMEVLRQQTELALTQLNAARTAPQQPLHEVPDESYDAAFHRLFDHPEVEELPAESELLAALVAPVSTGGGRGPGARGGTAPTTPRPAGTGTPSPTGTGGGTGAGTHTGDTSHDAATGHGGTDAHHDAAGTGHTGTGTGVGAHGGTGTGAAHADQPWRTADTMGGRFAGLGTALVGDIAHAEVGFFGSLLGFDSGFEGGMHSDIESGLHPAAGAGAHGATGAGAHTDAAHAGAAGGAAAGHGAAAAGGHSAGAAHETVDHIVGDPYALDELALRLYPNIRSRLRQELLIDRERAGLLADFR